MPDHTITIPATEDHEGYRSIKLMVPAVCIHCGGPRGEVYGGWSFDGSRRLAVSCWNNPCGHVEKYGELRKHYKLGV